MIDPNMPHIPDDLTFYRDYEKLETLCGDAHDTPPGADATNADRYSRNVVVDLDLMLQEAAETTHFTGRALVCGCFGGRYLSVTCRRLGDTDQSRREALNWKVPPVEIPPQPHDRPFKPEEKTGEIAEMTGKLIDELWTSLQQGHSESRTLTGLIVVSGRTQSGKSDIARALANRCLQAHDTGGRLPHLVTYEDPIEKLFAGSPGEARKRGFDYTPRQKGADAGLLRKALKDALRQTPAVFYVGETRDEKDWKELLRFAATGHLVITTAHAGSLVETMAQIVRAAGVRNPAQRSHVAGRLAALLHLRAFHPQPGLPRKVLVPAFWWRTPRSLSAFTAEGLGAILPNRPVAGELDTGCCGRAHFVETLEYLSSVEGLKEKAIEWDLRGE